MSVRCLFYSPIEGSLYDKRHWRNFAIFEPFPAWSSEMGNPCLSLIWMVALFYNSSLTLNLIDGCRVTTISLRTWNAERTMPPAIAVPAGGSGSASHESTSAPPYFGFVTWNRTLEAQLALVPLQFHAKRTMQTAPRRRRSPWWTGRICRSHFIFG